MSGAKRASASMMPRSVRPKTAMGLAQKSSTMRRKGVSTRAVTTGVASGLSSGVLIFVPRIRSSPLDLGQPHPWVQRRIQDVDGEVDYDEDRHDHEEVRHDHGAIEHA